MLNNLLLFIKLLVMELKLEKTKLIHLKLMKNQKIFYIWFLGEIEIEKRPHGSNSGLECALVITDPMIKSGWLFHYKKMLKPSEIVKDNKLLQLKLLLKNKKKRLLPEIQLKKLREKKPLMKLQKQQENQLIKQPLKNQHQEEE